MICIELPGSLSSWIASCRSCRPPTTESCCSVKWPHSWQSWRTTSATATFNIYVSTVRAHLYLMLKISLIIKYASDDNLIPQNEQTEHWPSIEPFTCFTTTIFLLYTARCHYILHTDPHISQPFLLAEKLSSPTQNPRMHTRRLTCQVWCFPDVVYWLHAVSG